MNDQCCWKRPDGPGWNGMWWQEGLPWAGGGGCWRRCYSWCLALQSCQPRPLCPQNHLQTRPPRPSDWNSAQQQHRKTCPEVEKRFTNHFDIPDFFVFTSICSSKYSILGLFESHIPKCQSDFTRNGTFENGQYCGSLSQALSHFGLIRFVAPVSLKSLHVPHSQLANEHQYFSGVPH